MVAGLKSRRTWYRMCHRVGVRNVWPPGSGTVCLVCSFDGVSVLGRPLKSPHTRIHCVQEIWILTGNLHWDTHLKAQNLTILSEKGIIWGASVKSALKLYQCLLLKGKLLSYDYDCRYKCTLFHRKFYLRVQETAKIKEPCEWFYDFILK